MMARLCARCLEPVVPVNECVCPDEDDEVRDGSEADDAA